MSTCGCNFSIFVGLHKKLKNRAWSRWHARMRGHSATLPCCPALLGGRGEVRLIAPGATEEAPEVLPTRLQVVVDFGVRVVGLQGSVPLAFQWKVLVARAACRHRSQLLDGVHDGSRGNLRI